MLLCKLHQDRKQASGPVLDQLIQTRPCCHNGCVGRVASLESDRRFDRWLAEVYNNLHDVYRTGAFRRHVYIKSLRPSHTHVPALCLPTTAMSFQHTSKFAVLDTHCCGCSDIAQVFLTSLMAQDQVRLYAHCPAATQMVECACILLPLHRLGSPTRQLAAASNDICAQLS